ncbi:hypothetical protein ELI_3985 [Eubacterium callanderi]|uniref:Uncharacterized protein n=1 Tax=Eubacterium callanderi TaxID=53442 RepID=E3GGX4_9FIRM|nr:hypothetical protein ELI_3985 [Eubacterium callanderi]
MLRILNDRAASDRFFNRFYRSVKK